MTKAEKTETASLSAVVMGELVRRVGQSAADEVAAAVAAWAPALADRVELCTEAEFRWQTTKNPGDWEGIASAARALAGALQDLDDPEMRLYFGGSISGARVVFPKGEGPTGDSSATPRTLPFYSALLGLASFATGRAAMASEARTASRDNRKTGAAASFAWGLLATDLRVRGVPIGNSDKSPGVKLLGQISTEIGGPSASTIRELVFGSRGKVKARREPFLRVLKPAEFEAMLVEHGLPPSTPQESSAMKPEPASWLSPLLPSDSVI